MKKNWKKSIKIGVSLLLVLCTVFSSFTVAFAAGDKGTIKYVSLGDSMTNGYAMSSGYTNENQGFQNTAADIYPTQFKNHLEDKGYNVDFYQYSMSAMRYEELHYLLNLPENANETPLAGRFCQVQEQKQQQQHTWQPLKMLTLSAWHTVMQVWVHSACSTLMMLWMILAIFRILKQNLILNAHFLSLTNLN